jgi:Domain of unknown function (DUF6385)
MIRQNYTAVVERNTTFEGEFASEPYECGWASEAIFYIRKLETSGQVLTAPVRVQISPDGIRWCDEGTTLVLSAAEVDFVRVKHFGNWLRIAGKLPAGTSLRAIVALSLKE